MSDRDLTAPSYAEIRKGNSHATEDAIRVVFNGLVNEITERIRNQSRSIDRFMPKVLELAPSAGTNNLDFMKSGVLNFTGSSAVNLTGIVAPDRDGVMLILNTTGSGTITVKHNSASSDSANRIVSASGADRSLATGNSLILVYLSGKWRDVSYQ